MRLYLSLVTKLIILQQIGKSINLLRLPLSQYYLCALRLYSFIVNLISYILPGSNWAVETGEKSLAIRDTYYYHYHPHSSRTLAKRTKVKNKPIEKRRQWMLHRNVHSQKPLTYSVNEDYENNISSYSHTLEQFETADPIFEYPHVVPYNKILVPNTQYEENIDHNNYSATKRRPRFTKKSKRTKKFKKFLKAASKTKRKEKKRRVSKREKHHLDNKIYRNPISKFLNGIYYQYFTQKDRQVVDFGLYPVIKHFICIRVHANCFKLSMNTIVFEKMIVPL